MSLSSTMNSALSGLTAARMAATTISDNIANALTPGYTLKSLELVSHRDQVPGVQISGVNRHADPAVVGARRAAEAEYAFSQTSLKFAESVAGVLGDPTDQNSLSSFVSDLEASLIEATSLPHSKQRLDTVALRLKDLAGKLHEGTDTIQNARQDADRKIAKHVTDLNSWLGALEDLNARIASAKPQGRELAALQDQRALLIDDINSTIPVSIISRDRNQVALVAEGGVILLDGPAAQLGFEPTPTIQAHMTYEDGHLGGLIVNGRVLDAGSKAVPFEGGTLAGYFEIRDSQGVALQAGFDAVTADLVERFQDPQLDPTLGPGQPGVLTDAGAAYNPTNLVGLAGRLSLNAALDPNTGGETWRLRAGIAAPDPGAPGDTSMLNRILSSLSTQRALASGPSSGVTGSVMELVSQSLSQLEGERDRLERSTSFAAGLLDETKQAELSLGVDTDEQLQSLLLVEQAYAANAQVVRTVDELMNILLEI